MPSVGKVILAAAASVSLETADLKIETRTEHGPRTRVIHFEKEALRGTVCGTNAVPLHQVSVKGFTPLQAPFSGERVPANCRTQVSWGEKRACLTSPSALKKLLVLRRLIERCLNI